MLISVQAHLHYEAATPCDLLVQIEATADADQTLVASRLTHSGRDHGAPITGDDGIGHRRWVAVQRDFICSYNATFDVMRAPSMLENLPHTPVWQTPPDVVKYLMPSCYCHPADFVDLLVGKFQGLNGGPLILAVADWIFETFTLNDGVSTSSTTATQSYTARAGVCRDFAHVLIAIARAAGIAARYTTVYAPNVTPQDFHAIAEVYLDGAWHLVDPTRMASATDSLRIAVGRDAADAAFMTSYGFMTLKNQAVDVSMT